MIVALEGGDGCGKGTVAQWLCEEHGFLVLRDPGATPFSAAMREVLLHKTEYALDARQMALMFIASAADVLRRAQELAAGGAKVVLDRTYVSTLVYQTVLGVPLAHLKIIQRLMLPESAAVQKVLYLRAPWPVRKERLKSRCVDRFEGKADEFHAKIDMAYDGLAKSDGFVVVDASQQPEVVRKGVAEALGLAVAS